MKESRWYKEGQGASLRGEAASTCPYAERSPKWLIWLEGFNHAD